MVSPFRIGPTVDPRRLSVNDSFRDVEGNIRRAVAKLNELWDGIHMSESMRVSRVQTAFRHICNLLNDMVASEENMVANVGISIENGLNEINSKRSQLGMDRWENKRAPPGSIELRNSIDEELAKLRPVFDSRLEEQVKLIEQVELLLNRLGIEEASTYTKNITDLIPEENFRALEARRLHLEGILQKRIKKAQMWQKEMSKFLKKLGNDAMTGDEDMGTFMELDFLSEETCVTDALMNTAEGCYNQLRDMYTDYVQEREFRWLELYTRLTELWEACHVADIERMIPPSYDPGKHDDKDFDKISAEISRLESLYAVRKDVFDALTAWKEKWEEKLALEEKKKSPDYFQNRGRENNVYLDAKNERTLNEHTLPKLMRKLKIKYEEYRKCHPNDEIKIDGFAPPEYVKWVVEEYESSKQVERTTRQMHRMVSTSSLKSQRTPQSLRGRLLQRPVSSSKIEPLRKRLRFDSTLSACFNATNSSIPSVITPTKREKFGPKHSSPKFSTPKLGSNKKRSPHSATKSTRVTRSPFQPSNKAL